MPLAVVIVFVTAFASILFFSGDVSAMGARDTEFTKAVLTGLEKCYLNGKVGKTIDGYASYTIVDNIFQNDETNYVLLPNAYIASSNPKYSCNALMTATSISGYNGALRMAGISIPYGSSSDTEKSDFLTNVIGYQKSSSDGTSSGEQCVKFHFSYTDDYGSGEKDSNYICAKVSGDSFTASSTRVNRSVGSSDPIDLSISLGKLRFGCDTGSVSCSGLSNESIKLSDYSSWSSFKAALIQAIGGAYGADKQMTACDMYSGTVCTTYTLATFADTGSYLQEVDKESLSAVFTIPDSARSAAFATAKSKLIDPLLGENSTTLYSEAEVAVLYQNYIKNVYKGSWDCTNTEGEARNLAIGQGYNRDIRLYDSSTNTFKMCLAKVSNEKKKVNGLDGSNHFTRDDVTLDEIIGKLNSLSITSLGSTEASRITDGRTTGSSGETVEESSIKKNCSTSGGSKSLGWIICPTLTMLSDASENAYEDFIEPSLQIDPKLFRSDGVGDNTKEAWRAFQTIANVIFVGLLLFVIFSQMTGIGIDNYGLKKTLPRLIVAAILVNLSYYICVLAIDVSTIVGSGFTQIIESLPVGDPSPVTYGGDSITVTAVTGAGILAAIVAGGAAIWASPIIIVSLLVSAIGIAISVFFLFVLLAVRQAAILLLVVLSPLAFAFYIFPNTKSIFDKWLKAFKGLILVYPIAALLVASGNYISALLMSAGFGAGGFVSAFSAMVVSIVPVFFIPTVLKNSFAALGNIGAKISGIGAGLSKNTTSAIRGADAYKNLQQHSLERQTRIKAGMNVDGTTRRLTGVQRFLRGGGDMVARNRLRYQKMISDRGSLEATEGQDFMLQTDINNEMKTIISTGEINTIGYNRRQNTIAANSLAGHAMAEAQRGNMAGLRARIKALNGKGEDGREAIEAIYDLLISNNQMTDQIADAFSDQILGEHAADFKNNRRTMFAMMQDVNQSRGQQIRSFVDTHQFLASPNNNGIRHVVDLANKVTSTTIGNMDDGEFQRIFGGYNNTPPAFPAGLSANEIKQIGAAAYAAMNDQNANLKADRRGYLQQLYAESREVSIRQDRQQDNPVWVSGNRVPIQHNNPPTNGS